MITFLVFFALLLPSKYTWIQYDFFFHLVYLIINKQTTANTKPKQSVENKALHIYHRFEFRKIQKVHALRVKCFFRSLRWNLKLTQNQVI